MNNGDPIPPKLYNIIERYYEKYKSDDIKLIKYVPRSLLRKRKVKSMPATQSLE